MKRNVSVFGLGYVGSVTAACLAHQGHRVVGVDSNAAKTESLESGRSPIIEKGLEDLIASARKDSRLSATTDAASAVLQSEISLICVGTPSQPNGKLDLTHIRNVCREIGQALRQSDKFHWVVLRSTVLPGTTENVVVPILEEAASKREPEEHLYHRVRRLVEKYGPMDIDIPPRERADDPPNFG